MPSMRQLDGKFRIPAEEKVDALSSICSVWRDRRWDRTLEGALRALGVHVTTDREGNTVGVDLTTDRLTGDLNRLVDCLAASVDPGSYLEVRIGPSGAVQVRVRPRKMSQGVRGP